MEVIPDRTPEQMLESWKGAWGKRVEKPPTLEVPAKRAKPTPGTQEDCRMKKDLLARLVECKKMFEVMQEEVQTHASECIDPQGAAVFKRAGQPIKMSLTHLSQSIKKVTDLYDVVEE